MELNINGKPALTAHAPLKPQFPKTCKLTEEIVPGAHAGSQGMQYSGIEDAVQEKQTKISASNPKSNLKSI